MGVCKCKYPKCHYEIFLNKQLDNTDYFNSEEKRCIFHSEVLQKEEKEKFLSILQKYIHTQYEESKKVLLKDTVFYYFEIDTKVMYNEIILEEITFECYPNFDYLECHSLQLKECGFHEGGRFKRVKIDSLEVRLKKVENALVFEMGGYAKDGLIQDDDGYIHKVVKYTNRVAGKGKVFFVGAKFEEEANFINTILDDVVFQNCDLTKARFLNAKVDATEFRNCDFPKNTIRKNFDELAKGAVEKYGIFLVMPALGGIFYWFAYQVYPLLIILIIVSFFTVISLSMYLFGSIVAFVSSFVDYNDHICTYDEKNIFKEMDDAKTNMTAEKRERFKETLRSLSQLYLSLQVNFEGKKDIQRGGDFFYSRRYIQLLSLRSGITNLIERSILIFHFAVNGFGERMGRPMLWLSVFTVIAVFSVDPNNDFVATKATPYFLLQGDRNITDKNTQILYNIDVNESVKYFGMKHKNAYSVVVPKLKENDKLLHDEMNSRVLFVVSRYIGMVTPANKTWFRPVSKKAYLVSTLMGVLSWFFIGAFLLALRNRIRRK